MISEKIKGFLGKDIFELLNHSKNYLSSNFIVAGLTFLTLPILTRLLSPDDFGILSIFVSFVGIFDVIFVLTLQGAISINYIKKDYPHSEYLFSNMIFLLFSNALFFVLLFAFSNFLGIKFSFSRYLIVIAGIVSINNVFISIKLNLLQIKKESKIFAFILALKQGGTILISLLVIYFMSSNRYLGQVYTTLIVVLIFAFYSFFSLIKTTKPVFKFVYVKDALKYGVPLIPHTLSGLALIFFDRIIINQLTDSYKTGIYSFAYQIGMIMQMIVISMNNAFQPIYWENIKKQAWDKINKIVNQYSKYIYFFAIALILFSKEIVLLIADPKYLEAINLIPIIILSYVFMFLYMLFSGISFYKKKTGLISLNTFIAASLNIGLNYLLIPKYGYQAAAWTTLVSYGCLFGLHFLNSKFVLKFNKLKLKSVMPSFFYLIAIFILFYLLIDAEINVYLLTLIKFFLLIFSGIYLLSNMKLFKKIISNKNFPKPLFNLLWILKYCKEIFIDNIIHIKFTKQEKEVIKRYNIESLKILHKKFNSPESRKYDFPAIKYRSAMLFNDLQSYKIPLKGISMLDLGTGMGDNLFFAGNYGIKEAIGIDYSKDRFDKFIQNNREKLDEKNLSLITYIEDDARKEALKDKKFGLVVSINSFEHFEDPTIVLKNIWDMCKKDSYVYLSFGPLFYSPEGAHRYNFTGVPYIQNIFPNETAFNFFYEYLKIDYPTDYSGKKIVENNPYAEMNKWKYEQYENLFLNNKDWEIITFEKRFDYRFKWFTKMLPEKFNKFSKNDLFLSGLKIVLKKK